MTSHLEGFACCAGTWPIAAAWAIIMDGGIIMGGASLPLARGPAGLAPAWPTAAAVKAAVSAFSASDFFCPGFLKHWMGGTRLWPEGLFASKPSAVTPITPSPTTSSKSVMGTNAHSQGGVSGSRPRDAGFCSPLFSQPKVLADCLSALKSPRTRSASVPAAPLTISFHRWKPNFRSSRSSGLVAPSSPLGKTAQMAARHLRPHRQARTPVVGCSSIALFRFSFSSRSLVLLLTFGALGSSLVVQRFSQAMSRCRSAANSISARTPPRGRTSSGSFRRPLRLRRRRLRLLLLRRRLRLRLFGFSAFWTSGGSLLESHTRCEIMSHMFRHRPSSGKDCMMTCHWLRTQSLKRFASTTAARLSQHKNWARYRFGAQSYAVRSVVLPNRSTSWVFSNQSDNNDCG
mmetsp:Transcript_113226/g.299007  ORF Transcript_113226/g.299007 Transcript_113226/m.299007 type:complete len:402 (-) Transcript_113226:542-1747(-)